MRQALKQGSVLAAPSVGVWRPALGGRGQVVVAGDVIGWLDRAGRSLEIVAPKGAQGAVARLAEAGTWVSAGTMLCELGDATAEFAAEVEEATAAGGPEGATAVVADTDGTIYLRPEPGSPLFADVGAVVKAQDTLALVEVMKTFTPVRAPFAGTVARVDAEDAGAVEAGEALFWIVPA